MLASAYENVSPGTDKRKVYCAVNYDIRVKINVRRIEK
jgi:hypothetical protein